MPPGAVFGALLTERRPEEVSSPDSRELGKEAKERAEYSMRLAQVLKADTAWPSALSELLQSFTTLPHVWTSRGDKVGALHFDTVDNVHTVVAGEKDFHLVI